MDHNQALTLSIVIPAYNEEHYLKACLDAIAAQTTPADEVILVDNNSTDTTVAIASQYSFVRILHEPQQGQVFARDLGFNKATSTIIGCVDADTRLSTDWVARVKDFYSEADHLEYAWTGGGYFYNILFPKFNGWIVSQIAHRLNRLITGYYVPWGCNRALPRAIWNKVFPLVCHRNDIHEDVDLAIHLHHAGYPITYEADVIVGVSLRHVRSNKEFWQRLQMWPATLRAHGQAIWVLDWMSAALLYAVGVVVTTVESFIHMFIDYSHEHQKEIIIRPITTTVSAVQARDKLTKKLSNL